MLQADGRISNLKLAEEVHLSPTAVLERVKRLTRDGYILGYEARLNPHKLGAGMLVFVEVLLDRTTPNVIETFKAAVQVRPEILECHLVAGGFDYLLKTRVADMHGLPRVRRHGAVAAARRARDAHLCGDGRGAEHRSSAAAAREACARLRAMSPSRRRQPHMAFASDVRLAVMNRRCRAMPAERVVMEGSRPVAWQPDCGSVKPMHAVPK